MICDNLKNCETYFGANSRFAQAFAFIKAAVAENYPTGRYEIDGDNLYALVQEYNAKLVADSKFEGHKRYIDIQYIISGEELMKVADISKVSAITEYDAAKDCMFFGNTDDASVLVVQQGEYAVFFPNDIHMPGVARNETPSPVRKIVVKVRV